jgi:aminoglycoside 6'-N-acetyltransferase
MSEFVWPKPLSVGGARFELRPATPADIPVLDKWDLDRDVISATSDDSDALKAFADDHDWSEELARQSDASFYIIAEWERRPFGAMQVIDPHLEPTHYWGEIEPNLRAIDIWIGEPDLRGKGHGARMMREVIEGCFADPAVTGIVIDPLASNTRAHQFYRNLRFKPVGRQMFGDDDCLVFKLTRADWRAMFPGD